MDSEKEPIQMHLLRDHTVNALRSRALHKQLLDSLSSKDFRCFKSLVDQNLNRQSIDIDIDYVDPNEAGKTYLEIACKDGLEDFAKFLLERGAKVNRINQVYNRGPIHFATENGHTGVLSVLLDEPTINPNLEAGQQTALHIAIRRNDSKAVELLLDKGASPNIPNNKGLTALHAAAIKGNRDMVERIMRKSRHTLHLDKYKDYNDQTTRDVLREKMPEIPLPSAQKTDVNVHDLKYYLNANDESNFLKCIEVVQNDVVNNELEDLIEMAVQRNFKDAVYTLLDRGEGIVRNLERAANIAIERGLPDILDRIFKVNGANIDGANINSLLLNACIELGMPGTEDSQIASDRLECLKLILRRDDVDARCTDSKGNTPLHYAARADCREAVTLLLEKGSYIGHMNNFGVPPVAHISESTLSQYFDECIETRKIRANEYMIELNYKCLIPYDALYRGDVEKREMDLFQYIADNNGLKFLLNHPLLSLFLYLKWRRVRCILCIYSIFYFFLWLLLIAYIVLATYKNVDMKAASTNSTGQVINEEAIESGFLKFLRISTAVTFIFLFFIEIIQLIFSWRYYVSNAGNCLKIILIISGFWMLWGAGVELKVFVVLLSAWEMVIMIGQYPWMSTHIEIFKKVSVNFIRFLLLYAFLILAFALAFFLLFKKDKNDDNFPDLEHSLFKTIIMLTGEFDANDIPFLLHPVQSRLVFVLFVFIIVIVLFNLLNGLAVSDTADILAKAKLVGLITKIRFIAYVENVAQFRRWNPRILLFPTFFKTGKLTFPYDPLRDSFIYKTNDNKWLDHHFKNKVFLDIMKEINEILSKRSKELHTEKMISVMEKVNERLALIEINLNSLKRVIENNNFNVRNDDEHSST